MSQLLRINQVSPCENDLKVLHGCVVVEVADLDDDEEDVSVSIRLYSPIKDAYIFITVSDDSILHMSEYYR